MSSYLELIISYLPISMLVSIFPGSCMLLVMSTSLANGLKASLVLGIGEVIGLSIIVVSSLYGIGIIAQQHEIASTILQIIFNPFSSWLYSL